jgi:hypothetical protein
MEETTNFAFKYISKAKGIKMPLPGKIHSS